MQIVIVRREPGVALSMDRYADSLVAELKILRPKWKIIEISPDFWNKNQENLWHSGTGLRKYYERFWRHPRAVSQLKADVVHIIDHSNAHITYWLKRSHRLNPAVVVTCHDLVQFVYPNILRDQSRFPAFSMASWKFSVRGMTQADGIIAVSKNTAKDISEMLAINPHQVTVAPNGVDSQFCRLPLEKIEQIRQQYGCSHDTICLLNVGSTHQRKNIFTILNVLVELRDRNLPVYLWKVGDDFTREQKAFIQTQNLQASIVQFGKPDKMALIELYNAADVLLSPSLYEGFGLTVLEAMACGTPVIAANVSSLPEVTGDAAILVEPTDVQAIVSAVCHLKQDASYRQTLIDKGLTRAQEFTWKRSAELVVSVYEQLTTQRSNLSMANYD
jgi:glycosyltransferase involved in cell wall biosynthesis